MMRGTWLLVSLTCSLTWASTVFAQSAIDPGLAAVVRASAAEGTHPSISAHSTITDPCGQLWALADVRIEVEDSAPRVVKVVATRASGEWRAAIVGEPDWLEEVRSRRRVLRVRAQNVVTSRRVDEGSCALVVRSTRTTTTTVDGRTHTQRTRGIQVRFLDHGHIVGWHKRIGVHERSTDLTAEVEFDGRGGVQFRGDLEPLELPSGRRPVRSPF